MYWNQFTINSFVTATFVLLISTSFEEIKADSDVEPDKTFNNEKCSLKYGGCEINISSVYNEKEGNDNNDFKIQKEYSNAAGEDSEKQLKQTKNADTAYCEVGTDSEKDCSNKNRVCEKLNKKPFYKCGKCKKSYEEKEKGGKCIGICSVGGSGFEKCDKEHKKCNSTKASPYYECTTCKDGYEYKDVGLILSNWQCIEFCTKGTKTADACSKKNRMCNRIQERPFYKCGECEKSFEELNEKCTKLCTKGTQSEKNCTAENKACKPDSSNPYFKCSGCITGYEKKGDSCVDFCTNGTESENKCNVQHKFCKKTSKKPFFSCSGCVEGYAAKGDKCVKYCGDGSVGQASCSNENRECYITKSEPFYECGVCKEGFTEEGGKCVDHCSPGTDSEKKCSAEKRSCIKEQKPPYFRCGDCISGFQTAGNSCLAYCTNGTDSEKFCTAMNRTCESKNEKPFYDCGKCKPQFGEKDGKCLDHCTEGLRGYNTCHRKNKVCKTTKTGLFYDCGECIFGYILKDGYCENPCDEKEEGWVNCSSIARKCVFNPGEGYKCGSCNNSDWIEDGIKCIDPCEREFPSEENTTWSQICKHANAKCKHEKEHNRTSCVCNVKDNIFSWTTKSCRSPCDHLFPNEENATWSEMCESRNASCGHDQTLNKTNCICDEENNVFNMSSKSCQNLCFEEVDGVIWSDFCSEINGYCFVNKNTEKITCNCKRPQEVFDERSKKCTGLCDHIFPDDNETWSEVCKMANAVCEYNLDNVNVMCKCMESRAVFNMTTKTCVKLAACDLNPCLNNGTCENINEDNYKCTCNDEWYGNNCEHQNLCNDDLCPSAKCVMNEEHHVYLCVCNDNEYFNYENKRCEDIACLNKVCSAFRECKNGECVCKHGFEEINKECKMTDEECEKNCGRKNVNCVNMTSPTEFTCACKDGYYLNLNSSSCEVSQCIYPFHPCEQICTVVNGSESCSCYDGFILGEKGCEIDQGNSCKDKDCLNGKCVKKNDTEVCVCNNGFRLYNDTQCIDICEGGYHELVQSLCPNGCTNENGKIRCICTGKYIQASDGISCIERDYCQEGDVGQTECSKVGKICKNHDKDPWYDCTCPGGLREQDGEHCTDLCSDDKAKECALTVRTCKYISGEEKCFCPLSMTFDEEYNACQFSKDFFYVTIDVRTEQPGKKTMYAMHKGEGSLMETVSSSMKVLYGPSLLDTAIIDCRNNGDMQTCTFSLTFGENADGVKNRLKDEQRCITLNKSQEYCILPPNLIVLRKSLQTAILSSNKCDEKIKHKFCPNESNICNSLTPGYSCLCRSGFNPVSSFILGSNQRYIYHTCEDIDECQNNPCWHNSVCENTYGSFECNCIAGYVLDDTKDSCRGVCDDNPCGNNGKCKISGDHTYKCECNDGYKGEACLEKYVNVYHAKVHENMIVIGTFLGIVILLSTSVIVALGIKLRRIAHKSYALQMEEQKINMHGFISLMQPTKDDIVREWNAKPSNQP